jgi:hypothetical protein
VGFFIGIVNGFERLFNLGFALLRTSRESRHRGLRPKRGSGTVYEKCKNSGYLQVIEGVSIGLVTGARIMAAIGRMETVEEKS